MKVRRNKNPFKLTLKVDVKDKNGDLKPVTSERKKFRVIK